MSSSLTCVAGGPLNCRTRPTITELRPAASAIPWLEVRNTAVPRRASEGGRHCARNWANSSWLVHRKVDPAGREEAVASRPVPLLVSDPQRRQERSRHSSRLDSGNGVAPGPGDLVGPEPAGDPRSQPMAEVDMPQVGALGPELLVAEIGLEDERPCQRTGQAEAESGEGRAPAPTEVGNDRDGAVIRAGDDRAQDCPCTGKNTGGDPGQQTHCGRFHPRVPGKGMPGTERIAGRIPGVPAPLPDGGTSTAFSVSRRR
jgi:hypothetical protein